MRVQRWKETRKTKKKKKGERGRGKPTERKGER